MRRTGKGHLAELRGRRYRIVSGDGLPEDKDGDCDDPRSRPLYEELKVRLYPSLRGRKRLTTLIHELLHGCLPDLDERAIDETARAVGKCLWSMGYRKGKE